MFRPEKMCFVNISVLDEYLTQILDRLTKLGVMHIVDKAELPLGAGKLKGVEVEPTRNKLTDLMSRAKGMLNILAIEGSSLPVKDGIKVSPFQIAEKVEEDLLEIEAAVSPVIQRGIQIQTEISDLEESSRQLSILDVQGVNIDDLRDTRFLYITYGDIPVEYRSRLIGSLVNVPCVMAPAGISMGRERILAFSLMSNKEILSNTLEAAYFSEAKIPEQYHGHVVEILDQIELEIWAKREEMAELQGELRDLRRRWRNKLLELSTTISTNQVVLESMENFGKTERFYFLSGWVPYKDVKRLRTELERITDRGIFMNASEPITARDAEHHKPKVPTKLKYPLFLRPFSGLIKNFGVPGYSGIDPTLFASLTFLVMFGVMFADVGHGSLLLLLGLFGALYPLPQLKPIRQLSAFLACCGGASVLFGLVFGSVFGKEGIINPIWFSLENMEPKRVENMLKIGVFFGVGMLSLGVFLSIVQSFRRKNFKEAFCGQWGIFGLISYWTAAFLLATKRSFSWDRVLIIVAFLLPIMLKEPVSRLIGKKREHGEEEAESMVESGFQVYEVVMAYLANTLSYIRMAAFNLSHAGLMMASYALSKELSGGSTFLSLPSDIMANAFVIALEGLIVAIQCMRLEYYEFFSKFFAGEGIEYKPLKIS